MTSLSICKTQTNLAITANFLRFEPLTLERMSIASRWIRASLLNTLLARHLELFSGRRLHQKSYHASVFHRILLSIAMQKMKCEWPQPRFLPSHAYSSRVRGCMSGPCNTVLVCFPCAPICLSALRVPLLLRFASVPVSVRSSLAYNSSIPYLLIPEPLQHLLQPWVNVLLLDVLTVQRQLLEITYSHLVQTPPRCPGHN